MKVSAATVTVTIISVVFFHGAVESSVSRCYYCLQTCMEPLIEEACLDSDKMDYKCVSSKTETDGDVQEVKGCVPTNDTAVIEYCGTINEQDQSSCFLCDTDLCNSTGVYSVSVLVPSCLVFFFTKVLE